MKTEFVKTIFCMKTKKDRLFWSKSWDTVAVFIYCNRFTDLHIPKLF